MSPEYVENILKLGLIQYKQRLLVDIGTAASSAFTLETLPPLLEEYDRVCDLIGDAKRLGKIAERVTKAKP